MTREQTMRITLHSSELFVIVLALLSCDLIKRNQFVFVVVIVAAVTIRRFLFGAQQLAMLITQQSLPQCILCPRTLRYTISRRWTVTIRTPSLR